MIFNALVTIINLILAMEFQPNPFANGVKHVTNLMLNSRCGAKTWKVVILHIQVWICLLLMSNGPSSYLVGGGICLIVGSTGLNRGE